MGKLLCLACKADAWYVYLGKSLCEEHFKEWSAKYAEAKPKPTPNQPPLEQGNSKT